MTKLVSVVKARSFIERCMKAIGTDPKHSIAIANMLIEADIRGHFTHGLYRLGKRLWLNHRFYNRPLLFNVQSYNQASKIVRICRREKVCFFFLLYAKNNLG